MSTENSPSSNESGFSKAVRFVEKRWIRLWSLLVILFLYAPIVVIVLFSFERGAFSSFPWDGFTLEWYRTLLETPSAINATFNSLFVAVFVTFFGTILGTFGAIALVRHEFRLKEAYRMLVIAPMTIPGLILGVALLMMFNYLEISRSLRTVIIGQLVFVVPFVLVTVSSRLAGFDPTLEEAARAFGTFEQLRSDLSQSPRTRVFELCPERWIEAVARAKSAGSGSPARTDPEPARANGG